MQTVTWWGSVQKCRWLMGPGRVGPGPAPPAIPLDLQPWGAYLSERSSWRSSRSSRPAGFDAHARPDRQDPSLGTPSPPIPRVLRGRPARHYLSASHPPPGLPLALDRGDHRRPRTVRTSAEPRLTSSLPTSFEQHHSHLEQWNPAPPDARAADLPGSGRRKRNGPPTQRPSRRNEAGHL